MKIQIKTKPTLIIPIDPTRKLTEEVVPTFEIAQKVPPPPEESTMLAKTSSIKAKAGKKYLDIEELLIKIPALLVDQPPLSGEEVKDLLNETGQDNQEPEVFEALEELEFEGLITHKCAKWFLSESNKKSMKRNDYDEYQYMVDHLPDGAFCPSFDVWQEEKLSGALTSSLKLSLKVKL